jgi:hypothetical protein
MAALFAAVRRGRVRRRRPRVFHRRLLLDDISDVELVHYRLPRHMIRALIDEYAESGAAAKTKRSNAIPAETEVAYL